MKQITFRIVTRITVECVDEYMSKEALIALVTENCDYSFTYDNPKMGVAIVDTEIVDTSE
jgi:hypothetical protein